MRRRMLQHFGEDGASDIAVPSPNQEPPGVRRITQSLKFESDTEETKRKINFNESVDPPAGTLGPIYAELFTEEDALKFPNGGIKYTIDLPIEWEIQAPPALRVVGRGSYATAVEATKKTSPETIEKVVVLVRPLDARLFSEEDCEPTRWSTDPSKQNRRWITADCLLMTTKEYKEEIGHITSLVRTLQIKNRADLLPTLYHQKIVSGSTEHSPFKQFNAKSFGVQVWKQMSTTVADYIRTTNMTEEDFTAKILPKINTACGELDSLNMFHYDPHLDNMAFDIVDGQISNVVFLDPGEIQKRNAEVEYDHMTSFRELKAEGPRKSTTS